MFQNDGMSIVDKARTGMTWIGFIAQTGSVTVEVFLHGRFGSRYLGAPSAAALLLIPIFGLFYEGYDLRPLIAFWWAYVAMLMLSKLGVLWRGRRSVEHSRYSGRPRLFRCPTLKRELRIKLYHEPLFVVFVSILLRHYSIPLSSYVLFAAVCLMAKTRIQEAIVFSNERDMQDAMIEQEQRIAQMRESQRQW